MSNRRPQDEVKFVVTEMQLANDPRLGKTTVERLMVYLPKKNVIIKEKNEKVASMCSSFLAEWLEVRLLSKVLGQRFRFESHAECILVKNFTLSYPYGTDGSLENNQWHYNHIYDVMLVYAVYYTAIESPYMFTL